MGVQVSISHPVFPATIERNVGLVVEPPFSRPIVVALPRAFNMPRNTDPVVSSYQVGVMSCGCQHLVLYRISAAMLYDDNSGIILDTFPVNLPKSLTTPEPMVIGVYDHMALVLDLNFPQFVLGVQPNTHAFQRLYKIKKALPKVIWGYGCYYIPGDYRDGVLHCQEVDPVDWREYLE